MEVINAIYQRRAVRSYTDKVPDKWAIDSLLRAAVQAPSAMNDQPWAFVIIEDRALLKRISDRAKTFMLVQMDGSGREDLTTMLGDPQFNIFYNAPELILICATESTPQACEDCCLAAQTLMLAAHDMGLATCPIGFARPWLNLPDAKAELGIPVELTPVFPVIVGYPKEIPDPHGRKNPEVVLWKK